MFISLGQCSLLFLYPGCLILFFCFITMLEHELANRFEGINKITIHSFFSSLSMIAYCLFGLKKVYGYYSDKKKKKEKKKAKNKVKQKIFKVVAIQSKGISYLSWVSIPLIILIACLTFIGLVFNALGSIKFEKKMLIGDDANILIIVIDSVLSRLILKYPIYRHHQVSLGICCIGFVLFFISIKEQSWRFPLVILKQLSNGFIDIITKFLLEKKSLIPSDLLWYIGCFGIPIYAILILILNYVPCPKGNNILCKDMTGTIAIVNFSGLFSSIDSIKILIACVIVLFYVVYFYTNLNTLFYFSPMEKCLGTNIGSFFTDIFFFAKGNKQYKWVWWLFGNIMVLVGSLIYNELIIFGFWGLDNNTKKKINQRSKMETSEELNQMREMEEEEPDVDDAEEDQKAVT